MQQSDILNLIPVGKKNAITNYELALETELRVECLNRMLKKLVKYNFIQCCADTERHYKSKVYYKEK